MGTKTLVKGDDASQGCGQSGSGQPLKPLGAAFYAPRRAGAAGQWWLLLHPPYTAWHLSYVAIGAALAPHVDLGRLAACLAAFFLGMGVAAHALDELHGRPLGTAIDSKLLVGVAAASLAGAAAIGVEWLGWPIAPWAVVGIALVVAYNLESFGGIFHTDVGFALSWGSYPVLVAFFAQTGTVSAAAGLAAAAAFFLSLAQRHLSRAARDLRRRATAAQVDLGMGDGSSRRLGRRELLVPYERALASMSWAMVSLGSAALATHLSH